MTMIDDDLAEELYEPLVTPSTALEWVSRLEKRLAAKQGRLRKYDAYYEGEHPLVFASEKFRRAFGGTFREFADNWCDLVVDAVDERMNVQGFRIPTDGAESASKGDKDAWRMWQANNLDADSQLAHVDALKLEESSALVWADPYDDTMPIITVESPLQMIVAHEAGNRRQRSAALKVWLEDDGYEYATLYLPTEIYKFRSRNKVKGAGVSWSSPNRWQPRESQTEQWPLPNPLGTVPVVPLVNRPRLLGGGKSEIKSVIPVQDAVNKLVADMMVASEFTSFRQRWVTGLEIPTDPETGQEIEPFKMAVDRLFHAESTDAKFGEFSETDLSNFVQPIEMLVQHIASQTRTPPHYFYLSGQFPSGESIKSAETGLVSKARRKMRHFGESWEEVIRLGFAVLDDPRSKARAAETIWGDPESRTESEHVDAVIKKRALRVPYKQLWEDAGYTPEQIDRFADMLREEQADPSLREATVAQPETLAVRA